MHTPVLLREVVDFLVTDTNGTYIDGTFGRGGHSRAILAKLGLPGRLLAIDRDPEAIACGMRDFADEPRFAIEHGSFSELSDILERRLMNASVSGVLLDLGVSSPQLDDPRRGFSFMSDGPLDMRMDPTRGISAAQWIAHAKEAEISQVLREYGEERFARRIAAAIVNERIQQPISSTGRLAQIVTQANPAWERGKHPATRAFQAIRIFINRELEALADGLAQALDALVPGGRLVVISFHSLEDRIVKRYMRDCSRPGGIRGLPISTPPRARRVGKSMRADDAEVTANPRARSATLRVAEKLPKADS